MAQYKIMLEVESETNPNEWLFPETLVIDEPYQVVSIEKVSA